VKENALERFPMLFLTVAMMLTGTVLGWFGWNAYKSYHAVSIIRERYFRNEELQGIIRHLDEVLTMSARLAAATGDLAWEQRYLHFEPMLGDAIKEVIKIEPNLYSREGAGETDAANVKLVEMEHRAFDLVRQNRQPAAREVLFSAAYEAQKEIYSQGMTKVAALLKKDTSDALRSEQERARINILAVAAALPTLLMGWFVVLRTLRRWRIRLAASNQHLDQQAQVLRELNADLDKRVVERTAELEAAHLVELKQTSELKSSEEHLCLVIASALDSVVAMDAEGRVGGWNPQAEATFGWSGQEAIGKIMSELIIPPQHREAHERGLKHFLKTGEGPVLNKRIEITALHRDGHEFPVELAISPVTLGGSRSFSAFVRDITARKRSERYLAAQYAATRVLAESLTLGEASSRILKVISEALGWDLGVLWCMDLQVKVLRCVEIWHAPRLELEQFEALSRQTTLAAGVGLLGRVWASGQPAWIPDVT
jgi:PAS domain S-box-containing protein